MNNARILLVFVFACTLFYAGAQVPNEPKPEEPVAKKVHWYDNPWIHADTLQPTVGNQ